MIIFLNKYNQVIIMLAELLYSRMKFSLCLAKTFSLIKSLTFKIPNNLLVQLVIP